MFPRPMDIILSTAKWQFALLYLDDVVIFWRSVEEHGDELQTTPRIVSRALVSLKQKNYFFI